MSVAACAARCRHVRLNGVIKLMREETINGERVIDNPVFRDDS